jgi:hypothetical protein
VDWIDIPDTIVAGTPILITNGVKLTFTKAGQAGQKWKFPVYANKELWQISWVNTANNGNGYTLKADLKDPKTQKTTDYQQTFTFYVKVKDTDDPYSHTDGTQPKLNVTNPVKATGLPEVRLNDNLTLSLFTPPKSNTALGMNQLTADGKSYRGVQDDAHTKLISAHKETPMLIDWTDEFVIRLYYNGYIKDKADATKMALLGPTRTNGDTPDHSDTVKTFTVWNQIDPDTGSPLLVNIPKNSLKISANTINVPLKPDWYSYISGSSATGVSLLPYGWRATVQQVKWRFDSAVMLSTEMPCERAAVSTDWFPDFILTNPVGVTIANDPAPDVVDLGSSLAPGHIASSSTVTVANASNWTMNAQQRFLISPVDLRNPSTWDFNDDLTAANGYKFGVLPIAGPRWDGFHYDPYLEKHLRLNEAAMDLPRGVPLNPTQSADVHFTRQVPTHQFDGGYQSKGEDYTADLDLTSLGVKPSSNGGYVFIDNATEVPIALAASEMRIFLDTNGNQVWDKGEPYYLVLPTLIADPIVNLNTGISPLGTSMGVSPVRALHVPTQLFDLGRMASGMPGALSVLRRGTLENTGNQTISGAGINNGINENGGLGIQGLSTYNVTTAATDPALLNALHRSGYSSVVYNGGNVSYRAITAVQPLALAPVRLPTDWTLFKSPAGASANYGRLFDFPLPVVDYQQPTGTYTGALNVPDSDSNEVGSTLSLRVNESPLSMVVPGERTATFDPRPVFDASKQGGFAWTNYLTGTESWPTAMVLPGKDSLGNPINDDLGVWVASNTPLFNGSSEHAQGDIAPNAILDPLTNKPIETDTNIWFHRVKRLTTAVTGINATELTMPLTVARQVRDLVSCTALGASPLTVDLIVLRNIRSKATDPADVWYGYAQAVDVATGKVTVTALTKTTWLHGPTETMVEILSHPWMPIMDGAMMDGLRLQLADPGVAGDKGPHPIRFTTPAVAPGAGNTQWLVWSVNAVQCITQNGKKDFHPFSYLAYKPFDMNNPSGKAFPDGQAFKWMIPATNQVKAGEPSVLTVREKPVLLTASIPVGVGGLVIYEGGSDSVRGLYYAYATSALDIAQPDWKIDVPISTINLAYTNVGRPQAWIDETSGKLCLIFQGRRVSDGNTDLYFAQFTINYDGAKKLLQLQMDTPPAGGETETLTPNATKTVFTGGKSLDWSNLSVQVNGGTATPLPVTDATQEYPVTAGGVMLSVDPYRGVVRVLTGTVTSVSLIGTPRVQRLTTHVGSDVNPTITVERFSTATPPAVTPVPRIWLYWTRQHTDGQGARAFYRTWRYDGSGRLVTEQRSSVGPAVPNVSMPERMLPMEISGPDGSITVTRQGTKAGTWVLTTETRSVVPPYPYLLWNLTTPVSPPAQHDLFLQVLDDPTPDN